MKFALISTYGSGTNLLRCFLNSHPDIFIDKEIFAFKGGFNRFIASPEEHIAKLEGAYSDDKPIVGVDIKYDQITDSVLEYFLEKDISIIHLFRDPFRTVWHNRNDIPKEYLDGYLTTIYSYRDKIKCTFPTSLEIHYEDMTRGQEINLLPLDIEQKVIEFLGASYMRLEIDYNHSTKPLKVRV